MFCPNENAISSLGDVSRKMMDYAISKKITLVGPSMLYYALKTVEYFWKSEKQNKNKQVIIELANKVSSQAVDIYETAKKTQDSITKTSSGVDDIMNKIQDGKGSFLSKISRMNKIGGLSPKKEIPEHIQDEDPLPPENENDIPLEIQEKTSSLSIDSGKKFNLALILSSILNEFEYLYVHGWDHITTIWQEYCVHQNDYVTFHDNEKFIHGKFMGITESGHARMHVNGKIKTFSSGIITL